MVRKAELFPNEINVNPANEAETAEAQFRSDAKLQELIRNYQRAADELSRYLENSTEKVDASEIEVSEKKLKKVISKEEKFPEEPLPGRKEFQEKRLKNLENKKENGRISSEQRNAKIRAGILKNTMRFVKEIFK